MFVYDGREIQDPLVREGQEFSIQMPDGKDDEVRRSISTVSFSEAGEDSGASRSREDRSEGVGTWATRVLVRQIGLY